MGESEELHRQPAIEGARQKPGAFSLISATATAAAKRQSQPRLKHIAGAAANNPRSKVMEEKTAAQGWDRAQLTLRLPAARLAQLRALAKHMGEGATPTDAVIRAINMAAGQLELYPNDARLDAIEDELNTMTATHTLDTDRLEAAILAISQSLSQLHSLISEVASQAPDDF